MQKERFFPFFFFFPSYNHVYSHQGGGEGLLEIIDHCYAKATT